VVAAACLPLALLSDRAFDIDEPLFLWLAEQITREPLDFFGFEVNWYGTSQPMYAVTRNPPLVGYAIAAAAAVVGWSERALHGVFLLPAAAAALGSLSIARRLAPNPPLALLAACLGVATPVFLVSSNTIMSDTPMLALWCVAVACWLRGASGFAQSAEGGCARWLWAAGALAAVAAQTKYFGVALTPLLAAHALAARLPPRVWLAPLALPLLSLLALELCMHALYGTGALSQAVDEALHRVGIARPGLLRQAVEGLAFAGGCVLPALVFAPWLWSRRALTLAAVAVAAAVGLAPASLGWLDLPIRDSALTLDAMSGFGPERIFALQFFSFVAGGISILALAVAELRRGRDADRVLLVAWVLGSFVFAAFVNWTNNGRSNLVLAAPVAILIVRRLAERGAETGPWLRARPWGWALPLAVCAAVALAVAQADRLGANSVRQAAREIGERFGDQRPWFHGHWGWQFYIEREGGRAVDWRRDELDRGDLLVVLTNNAERVEPGPERARRVATVRGAAPGWLRTQAKAVGASYNASNLGPVPFVLAPVVRDEYRVYRVLQSFRYERWFDWADRPAALADPGSPD
jgi:4-amino-4-deoxy-L-arabinose transferase-like glycosyltransferase